MAKERMKDQTQKRARQRKPDDEQQTRVPFRLDPGMKNLQRQMGNRSTERMIERFRLTGETPLRDLSLAQVRQVTEARLAISNPTATLQRQADAGEIVALNVPAGVQTGKVTIEQPKIEDYDVTGSKLSEVYSQLDPEEWGRCRWVMDYDYDTVDGKATKVNITLHLIIRLPRWTNAGSASALARAEWQRMLHALRAHEEGHADIARKWAPLFKDRLLRQPEDKLKEKYQNALDDLQAESDKYDQDTQHGQNQNVSLDTTIQ